MSGTRCTYDGDRMARWRRGWRCCRRRPESADGFDGTFTPLYPLNAKVEDKIDTIVCEIYGADGVQHTKKGNDLARIDRIGLSDLPICMAKTQKSLSDDPAHLGRPTGFSITVREVDIRGCRFRDTDHRQHHANARPNVPAAHAIDIDESGAISGL